MIVFLYFIFSLEETYDKCAPILQSLIPVHPKSKEGKENVKKLEKYFGTKPTPIEISKICNKNKDKFLKYAQNLKEQFQIEDCSREELYRYIAKNQKGFAYIILTTKDKHPGEIEAIKNDFLEILKHRPKPRIINRAHDFFVEWFYPQRYEDDL